MKESRKDAFFRKMEALALALTYDDVRIKTGHSEVEPRDVSIESRFSRNIPLHCPIISAAMDTVTEAAMAIAMAKFGGLGVIHRGKKLTPEAQAEEVRKVKLHLNNNGPIETPMCVNTNDTIDEIQNRRARKQYGFHTFPVLNKQGKLVGLLTRNDFDFCEKPTKRAREVMTPLSELITAPGGTTFKQAHAILLKARKKVLPLLGNNGEIAGMYVFSDLKKFVDGTPTPYNIDAGGHLRAGAAVGTGTPEIERAALLVEAHCDVLVIDTAHGDSRNTYETLKELKRKFPNTDVVVGNVSEGDSARQLAHAGADGVKVGQGPGSICTTRIVAGIGCPQVTAVYNCAKVLRGSGVPLCADGGIVHSGDIAVAIGAGADCVMLGFALSGTTETPGEIKETKHGRMKVLRGMGSLGAMQESQTARARYRQEDTPAGKLVPEGITSLVSYKGDVERVLVKHVGGLRSGLGYVGAASIKELQEKADFHRLSSAGLAESHPHDVIVTETEQD